MDDDDDDFFDDEVLSRLDEVERKYQEERAQVQERAPNSNRQPDQPPPLKRPRLDAPARPPTRQPSIQANYVPPGDDDDDMVILIDDKGNYSLDTLQTASSSSHPARPQPTARVLPTPGPETRALAPATRPIQQQPRPAQPQPHTRPQLQTRQSHPQPSSFTTARARQVTPALRPSTVQPRPTTPAVPVAQSHASSSTARQPSPGRLKLESEMSELKAQMAKMQESHEAFRRSTEEEKWTSAGEAANLRRALEQRNAQHNAELAKAKAEKQQAEAALIEKDKVLKEEMERMKTRFIIPTRARNIDVETHLVRRSLAGWRQSASRSHTTNARSGACCSKYAGMGSA
ncbi:hypothetical protein EXIGLDRAFT_168268 [Exidia glandulosa HHB12029]|uniref:Uncharacterized protein n=1 Tax=Exidia glandulosa HHB12029 TaxID=1314781 RepID=A0A165N6I4_EXIGL|nr:hypothetical protein EXIGLDRAFT_168268 [Exidia glandulosa HHB12029]